MKISIIVPIYNSEKYLSKCIDSLIQQSMKEIEIILLNDGSTDDSELIIKKYKDERIKYISKNNEGISKTRNLGIEISRGEFITFVDSDDRIDEKFCEKMYSKAKKEKCDIVICDYYNVENSNTMKIELKKFKTNNISNMQNIINNINLGPCNKIYSSKVIKGNKIKFPENLKYEDAPFVCKALVRAKKIGKINEGLSYFNVHEGSQTTTRDENIVDILSIADLMKDYLYEKIDIEIINKLIVKTITNYLVQSRYIENAIFRNEFIDKCYLYLYQNDSNWILKIDTKNIIKKQVIKTPLLMKLYATIYNFVKN